MTEMPRFAEQYEQTARLPWLADLKAEGLERYRKLGLPTPKVESWKYTNLRRLERIDFQPHDQASDESAALDRVPSVDAFQAVLVNGRFRPDLSTLDGLPDGVLVAGLDEILARDPHERGQPGPRADEDGVVALLVEQLPHGRVPADDVVVDELGPEPLQVVDLGYPFSSPTPPRLETKGDQYAGDDHDAFDQ